MQVTLSFFSFRSFYFVTPIECIVTALQCTTLIFIVPLYIQVLRLLYSAILESVLIVLSLLSVQDTEYTVHRVSMATFWCTFHHDGKISPAWWGWSVHAPFSLYLPSRVKFWCTLQLRWQIHCPCFSSTPICTLWSKTWILFFSGFILFLSCRYFCLDKKTTKKQELSYTGIWREQNKGRAAGLIFRSCPVDCGEPYHWPIINILKLNLGSIYPPPPPPGLTNRSLKIMFCPCKHSSAPCVRKKVTHFVEVSGHNLVEKWCGFPLQCTVAEL
jgi:hypothetical protein